MNVARSINASIITLALLVSAQLASADTQQAKLTVQGLFNQLGNVGDGAAIDGDTAVLGITGGYNSFGVATGIVAVWIRNAGSWTIQQIIAPSTPVATYGFGASVAIDGDTIVVGCPNSSTGQNGGAAYVFVRVGSLWTQQTRLVALDASTWDAFGTSVAVSGDVAVIGAPHHNHPGNASGSAYTFIRTGGTWIQEQELFGAGSGVTKVGSSVAVLNDCAIVGAPNALNGNVSAGAAYVFARTGTFPFASWTPQQTLFAGDGANGAGFGSAVSMRGDQALIGATNATTGSAYVFDCTGSQWSQTQKLMPWLGSSEDSFGSSVALGDGLLVVGARFSDLIVTGGQGGAVYPFIEISGTWRPLSPLIASDHTNFAFLGTSVAISGSTVVVGAPYATSPGIMGAGYVYSTDLLLPSTYCVAKVNSQGCIPQIGYSGIPSVSSTDDFYVTAAGVLNNKPGTMMWGLAPLDLPFQGGTLCINPPITRSPVQSSAGGTPQPVVDCSGSYSYHFSKAYMLQKGLTPGYHVYCQYWSRDPGFAPPNGTGLTDGLVFEVDP